MEGGLDERGEKTEGRGTEGRNGGEGLGRGRVRKSEEKGED